MSWSIEEHIGEGRPWPEQVVVYRGETDESLTYARRSLSDVNQMVELMDTLAAENAKLRELAAGIGHLLFALDVDYCATCPRDDINHPCPVYTVKGGECLYKTDLRDLGVEVDA